MRGRRKNPGLMADESRDRDAGQESRLGMDSSPAVDGDMVCEGEPGVQQVQSYEVVKMQYSRSPHESQHSTTEPKTPQEKKRSELRSSDEAGDDSGQNRSSLNFLSQPLSFLWRRLKWSVILSLGRNDSFAHMSKEDMKTAIATQLEVAIMGSALVLTLCLQMQEVVGSRGGFTLPERDRARFMFVSSSALSFSLAFYSIITSAMMLLSINAVPRSSAERFFTGLSSWSAVPRLCTLTGALCLGMAAMSAFFLGLENTTAWVGVSVTAIALLMTIVSTIYILIRVKRFQADLWEEGQDSASRSNTDYRLEIEPDGSPTRKFPDISCHEQGSPCDQPVLTPLSSLTNTTGFSIRTSRFRN